MLIRAFCTVFPIAFLLSSCASTPVADPARLFGEYTTVSESSCNVTLELLPSRSAKITNTCRVENGSGRDERKETMATWTANGERIVVGYGSISDELEFTDMLPYAPFGRSGAGPGLRIIRTSGESSALGGYEALWRMPIGDGK